MKRILLLTTLMIPILLNALARPEDSVTLNSTESGPLDLETIDIDSNVLKGELDNGLDWYIRPNDFPSGRAEIRLIVNAGSVLETEEQRGIAHFLEHMAFNGTKEYPENELIDFLQSLGMEFGPDINASTSYDNTTYQLTVNTANPEELDKALNVIEEWAFNIDLTQEQIDKERPVIIEEWRMGRDATTRMAEKSLPIILYNSLYGERLPIGLTEVIETAPVEVFQDFYEDWYRPDLMSLVVVGDVDPLTTEKLIEAHFAPYSADPSAPERINVPIPEHKGPLFTLQTDPEATTSSLEIINKFTPVTLDTAEAWDLYYAEQLFSIMFNNRITEKLRQGSPDFINGYGTSSGYSNDKHLFQWGVMTNPGELQRGFRSFWTEVERVRRYGFTASELERAGKQIAAGYEYMLKETPDSQTLTAIITSAVTSGDKLSSLEWEYAKLQELLTRITPEEVRRVGDKWFTDDNRVISFMGRGTAPTEDQLTAVMIEIKESPLSPYEEGRQISSLMDQLPQKGSIVKREYREDLDYHTWTLSNGAKVVLKKTDIKDNEILFTAKSPGGVSQVIESYLISSILAPTALSQSGLAMMTLTELEQFMSDKSVSLSPSIEEYFESLNGFATPSDLEYLFQLTHLTFTAPQYRPSSWEPYAERLAAYLSEQDQDPMEQYSARLNQTIYMGHPYSIRLTSETLDQMDYDKAYALFRERFFDADDFTFYFVGALDFEVMEDFVTTYLASLLSDESSESWNDVGLRYNKSHMVTEVEAGLDPKSVVTMAYAGDLEWSYEKALLLSALGSSLENRLLETVREEEGGVYSISVSTRSHQIPVDEYALYIQFSCDPERVDEIIGEVESTIELFKGDLDLTTYTADTVEAIKRVYGENLQSNSWYLSKLSYTLSRGLDPALMLTEESLADSITADDIRQAAKTYLRPTQSQIIILKPSPETATE